MCSAKGAATRDVSFVPIADIGVEVCNALGSGPLIFVIGINMTAAFALEEVHIISLFAPFNGLPELQFAATTRTRARIGTGGLHRTCVTQRGQMDL